MKSIKDNSKMSILAGAALAVASLTLLIAATNVVAEDDGVEEALEDAHKKFKGVKEGKNADYIPALAEVPSKLFGISLVTVDGKTYDEGDTKSLFSIQSISKVFTLAQVLQESGEQAVEDNIGVDATGQPFNSINAIEQHKGSQQNPFVNPGAITATGMVKGKTYEEKWNKILAIHSAFAGRQLDVNGPVYKSEAETNQRNQAIAALMSAYGHIEDDTKMVTDIYTRQCAINVSSHDLAVMAATLANGGKNPVTGQQVIAPEHVSKILAVMSTAGLYDDSGIWLYNVGLPAKSGVGGGIIAVSPGKFGIAAFSPPLDAAGNSVKAQRAIEYVSNKLGGNPYSVTPK
jgi:glutaminase